MKLFITGTDTNVGKTIATYVLGVLLQDQGIDVGAYKPVQCAGNDAQFLKDNLNIADELSDINPFFAKEPLSPHLAFSRQKTKVSISKILSKADELASKHDLLLVEGAGGLCVPITPKYHVSDLVRDLDSKVIVVARLGLGTINHTLLTINQLHAQGADIAGVIFSDTISRKKTIAEQTNIQEIEKQIDVPIIGKIPYLKSLDRKNVLKKCRGTIDLSVLLKQLLPSTNNRLKKWDKDYVWHPFTQMRDWLKEDNLIIDRGEGSYLIDIDGKRYLDGVSSLWVTVHGHRKKEIDQAVKDQINKISHSTLLGLSNTPAVELSKKLVEITPKGLDKVFYSDNGSTSVEIAIKMAYQYWQNIGQTKKTNILHLSNSYHGDTLGSVSIGGIDLFHKVYRNLIFKTLQLELDPKNATQALVDLERLYIEKAGEIAAFVVEPLVQGAAGMLMWPRGVLKQMETLSKKHDVLFIVDEVATGFGRTGTMFACEQERVNPDFICLSKGLTGGYLPLAATLTSQRVYDGFCFPYKDMKTFFHGHTYTGNPLACVAAIANIKVFEKEQVLTKLTSKIKYLSDSLQMFYNLPSVVEVRQRGFMVGIELGIYDWQDKVGAQVCMKAREYGIILRPLGNVIVLMPPLSISKKELKVLIEGTYKAINEITQSYST